MAKQLFDNKIQLTIALRSLLEVVECFDDPHCPERQVGWVTVAKASDPLAVLLAYVYFYDQRGGGVETANKEDKQGLETFRRNKKRFAAQSMLTGLEILAHNTLGWARHWLAHLCPVVAQSGMLRLVRDAFRMNGVIVLDRAVRFLIIVFNQAEPLAKELQTGFSTLFAYQYVVIALGKT